MAGNDREIELKLELDEGGATTLRAHPALAGLSPVTADQHSTYYDTPGGALRKAGFSLRLRASKGRLVQTVKLQADGAAGLFDRPEWECDVAGPDPDLVAAAETPLGALLGRKVRAQLRPVIRSDVTRTTWLTQRDGSTIALVLDEGEVTGGDAGERIVEVELELEAGAPASLIGLAQELAATVPARLGVLTKAERGYRLTDGSAGRATKADRIALDDTMSAAAALAAIASSCLRQFRLNEPLVAVRRDPSALHQARVAMRRLRSAFSLFRPIVAGDATFAILREEVRWLTDQLGDARNLDVLLKRVGRRSKPLRAVLEAERERAYARVLEALHSGRLRRLLLDLVAWIELGEWRQTERARAPIRPFVSARLDKSWRKVRKGGRKLARIDAEARHDLRIDVKKLRYAIEFTATLHGGDAATKAETFAAEVEEIQERLGDLNDAETARILLEDVLGNRADRDKLLRSALKDGKQVSEDKIVEAASAAHERLVEIGRFWR
jgi:inorganic triphosphatase YgiF